ncbi:MAG: cell division protein FtsL [Coriobacteriia bacterium]|nr:cell division protein FtsL [Coriobacteriia bacterium]
MAAPAYSYASTARTLAPQRERTRRPERRPDVRVVPGSRQRTQSRPLAGSSIKTAFVIGAALAVIAALCVARLFFAAGAASVSMETNQVSSNLDQARSVSSQLEVQTTSLANPERVKAEATKLGMVLPYDTATIVLPEDVVATTEDGSLSLSESLSRATGANAGK